MNGIWEHSGVCYSKGQGPVRVLVLDEDALISGLSVLVAWVVWMGRCNFGDQGITPRLGCPHASNP